MGYLAPGEIFENMLQVKRFCVHFERVLNTTNFHIEIMISVAHIPEDWEPCSIESFF